MRNPFSLVLSHFLWIAGVVCPDAAERQKLRCRARGVSGYAANANATDAVLKRQFRRWAPTLKERHPVDNHCLDVAAAATLDQ